MLTIAAVSVISKMSWRGSTPVRSSSRSMSASKRGVADRAAREVDLERQLAAGARCSAIRRDRLRRRPSGRSPGSGRSARRSWRKRAGGISSPCSSRIRSSSSYWRDSPVARSTIGCACSTKRSLVERVADALAPRSGAPRSARRRGSCAAYSATRSRPASLASYIARSALTSSVLAAEARRAVEQRDADAGGDRARGARSAERRASRADRREQLTRRPRSASRGAGLRQQDRELVAAEPREHVGLAQARAQQRRATLDDQLVAGVVAERVVDVLEVVEVEHQRRALRRRSAATRARCARARARSGGG